MGKDPAFLFYPGDYLQDTQCLSEKAQVAYDRIMCEHMRNICISHDRLKFFTKRLNDDEVSELKSVMTEVDGGFQIEWVALSIEKRKAYSESRRSNRKGKNKKDMSNICETHEKHMENENGIVNGDVYGVIKNEEGSDFNPLVLGTKIKLIWDEERMRDRTPLAVVQNAVAMWGREIDLDSFRKACQNHVLENDDREYLMGARKFIGEGMWEEFLKSSSKQKSSDKESILRKWKELNGMFAICPSTNKAVFFRRPDENKGYKVIERQGSSMIGKNTDGTSITVAGDEIMDYQFWTDSKDKGVQDELLA